MHQRCENPKHKNWKNYGARGIRVCERWSSFEVFASDMGRRPAHSTIERQDNDGDYTPSNCVWVEKAAQAANTRKNVRLTLNGETQTIAEWSRVTGIGKTVLQNRHAKGWSDERTLTELPSPRAPRMTASCGARIRELAEAGKKQNEIAVEIGCSQMTVSRVLRGVTKSAT